MPPLSIFDSFHGRGKKYVQNNSPDASSSHSTISVRAQTNSKKGPISPVTCRNSYRRRVAFENDVRVYPSIHHLDYSEEERKNAWLTLADLEAMKVERKICLRLMDQNPTIDNDEHYFRGLEAKTKEGFKRKRFNMVDACMTVVEEQSDQEDMITKDPEAIARAYIASSTGCVDEARKRGLLDQKAVETD